MYVVVRFYPLVYNLFFFLWGIVMYDNEFETKKNEI